MPLLSPGSAFPALTLTQPGGTSPHAPGCLRRRLQRRAVLPRLVVPVLQRAAARFPACRRDSLAETGVKVAALSVDDEPTTADLIARHGLTFPVGHSADARAIAGLTGAFVNPDPVYLQSTGFVLDPAGRWWSACTPAAPSAGSSPRTSPAWSATCASTRRPDVTTCIAARTPLLRAPRSPVAGQGVRLAFGNVSPLPMRQRPLRFIQRSQPCCAVPAMSSIAETPQLRLPVAAPRLVHPADGFSADLR